jgi:hypothetical protein
MNGTTILNISAHATLTPAELERFAYVQGDGLLACYAGEADDLVGQVEGFDDLIDAAKQEAFEAGKREGLGLIASEMIEDLQHDVLDLKASHQRCRDNLQAVYEWLRSDDCKTCYWRSKNRI